MSGEEGADDEAPVGGEHVAPQLRQRSQAPSGSFPEEKPVKLGEELDVTITEVSRRGDGVARIEGFVVFVPRGVQGQKARIRITSVKANFAVAELLQPPNAD